MSAERTSATGNFSIELMHATYARDADAVRHLLRGGVDVNAVDEDFDNALMHAATTSDNKKVITARSIY